MIKLLFNQIFGIKAFYITEINIVVYYERRVMNYIGSSLLDG